MAAWSLIWPVFPLQAAEGPVLGSPAPALFCCHELLPLPTLPGGVSSSTDPGGTTLRHLSLLGYPGPCGGLCHGARGLPVSGMPLCACEAGGSVVQQLSHFPCLPLQTLLSECIAPHMEDMGTVSASAPAPAAYLCKMFR